MKCWAESVQGATLALQVWDKQHCIQKVDITVFPDVKSFNSAQDKLQAFLHDSRERLFQIYPNNEEKVR